MATDNYLEKLARTLESLRLPPGSLTHVSIAHHDWCAFLRGQHCNCQPTLVVHRDGARDGARVGGDDGGDDGGSE